MAVLDFHGALGALMGLLDQPVEVMITAENHAQGMPPVVLEGVLVAGFDAQLLDELNLSDVTVFALAGSDDAARLHLERSHFREAHQLPGGLLLLRTGGLEISIGPAIART